MHSLSGEMSIYLKCAQRYDLKINRLTYRNFKYQNFSKKAFLYVKQVHLSQKRNPQYNYLIIAPKLNFMNHFSTNFIVILIHRFNIYLSNFVYIFPCYLFFSHIYVYLIVTVLNLYLYLNSVNSILFLIINA